MGPALSQRPVQRSTACGIVVGGCGYVVVVVLVVIIVVVVVIVRSSVVRYKHSSDTISEEAGLGK